MNDTRRVPREADIPYFTSPPVQFNFQSTATLSVGAYTWNDNTKIAFSPKRPILENALYFFRSISVIADIEELDFTSNLTTPLQIYSFLKSDAKSPLYREPFQMDMFYRQFQFPFFWRRHMKNDQLFGAVKGVITQGPSLIGKSSITVKMIISATEVTNEGYVKDFVTDGYPTEKRK